MSRHQQQLRTQVRQGAAFTGLHDAMFVESNPGPVKYAASRIGLCSADMRLPLVAVSDATRKIVDAALAKVGLIQARAAE